MATDDDDAATLRERVRELEQTVAQQQDTIQQLIPSRRAILAGGAGLVGGAALTGQASAQSAAGQVGTASEPVDVEAASVNADSVNTGEITIGGSEQINQIEFGSVDFGEIPASSDGTMDTFNEETVEVNFDQEFDNVPEIVVGGETEASVIYTYKAPSTTGFTFSAVNYSTETRDPVSPSSWVAIG